MISHKSFWNDTLVYTVGFLFIRAVSFLLLPLHTNFLDPQILGFVFLLLTLLAFLNAVFNHGMDSALLKFFHQENFKEVVSTSFLYSAFSGLFFSCVLIVFKDLFFINFISNFSALAFILLISTILFFDMLSSKALNVLRMTNNKYYFLFVCFINVISSLGFNVVLIKNLSMGFDGAFLSIVGTALAQFLCLLPVVISYVRLKDFNFSVLLKMLKFALPIFPSAVFLISIELSDRWMLRWLDSMASVGLYGTGYKIATLILIVVNSFNISWQPYYLKNSNIKNYKNFGTIGTSFLLILLFLCSLLSICSPYFAQFSFMGRYIIDSKFWGGVVVVPVVAFSYLFYGLFILQTPSIYLKNKQNWLPVFWGSGLVVNVLSNLYLIPKFSFMGAAIATLLSYFGMSIFIIYKNKLWLPVQYSYKPILELVVFSLVVVFVFSNVLLSPAISLILVFLYCFRAISIIKNYFIFPL